MAAAFERARAALDRLPPLSGTVERALRRCGPNVDLLLETAMIWILMGYGDPLVTSTIVPLKGTELINTDFALLGRPLLSALQQDSARCDHCSPLGRLVIQSGTPSGSSAEGFMPWMFGDRGKELAPIWT